MKLTVSNKKKVIKTAMNEWFGSSLSMELWKNYKSADEKGEPRSFTPLFCPYISSAKTPLVGISRTIKECIDIVSKEDPSRIGFCEIEPYVYKGETFYIVYD